MVSVREVGIWREQHQYRVVGMAYDDEPIFLGFESVPIKVDLYAPKGHVISPLFFWLDTMPAADYASVVVVVSI